MMKLIFVFFSSDFSSFKGHGYNFIWEFGVYLFTDQSNGWAAEIPGEDKGRGRVRGCLR